MKTCQASNLIPWVMLTALNTAVLVEQQQKQRPLSSEEIEECHLKAMACADVLREGYLDGLDQAFRQQLPGAIMPPSCTPAECPATGSRPASRP